MNLDDFIANPHLRNSWISERDISVYVRRSIRFINEEAVPCLDIGSVEVDEDKQGQGIFSEFLSRFEREAKKLNRVVFVESILNKGLFAFLLQRGYILQPHSSEISPNLFKVPT